MKISIERDIKREHHCQYFDFDTVEEASIFYNAISNYPEKSRHWHEGSTRVIISLHLDLSTIAQQLNDTMLLKLVAYGRDKYYSHELDNWYTFMDDCDLAWGDVRKCMIGENLYEKVDSYWYKK